MTDTTSQYKYKTKMINNLEFLNQRERMKFCDIMSINNAINNQSIPMFQVSIVVSDTKDFKIFYSSATVQKG